MTLKIFNGVSTWSTVQRLKVFRNSVLNTWTTAKKVSVWRGSEASGYWSIVYPDPPFAILGSVPYGATYPGSLIQLSVIDPWDVSPYREVDTTTYQWQRSTDSSSWLDISSATSSSYTAQTSDIGYYLRCRLRGTNERGYTDVNSSNIGPVTAADFTFQFNVSEFGVNANSSIFFDKTNGVFPDATTYLTNGRVFSYFFSDSDHYQIYYRSDGTNFRIFHEMYRSARLSRPASPDTRFEIVFTNGSKVVDVYVVKGDPSYLLNYVSYLLNSTALNKDYASYNVGYRYRVTLDATTATATAIASGSTTTPSLFNGWIPISGGNDSDTATITFSTGSNTSSSSGSPSAFTKDNMFFPGTPTVATPAYVTSTTGTVSWSGSDAASYYVTVKRNDTSAQVFSLYTTSTSATLQGLTKGVSHTVSVAPNSRSDYYGQYGFAGTNTFTHATTPGLVQSITASSPVAGLILGSISSVDWTVSWSAPADNGGATVTSYDWATDWDAAGTTYTFGGSTNTTSTSATVQIVGGLQAYVRVRANNSAGSGDWSQITLNSSPSQPGTPSAGAISSTNAQTSVNWAASNANGGTGLSYRVYRSQNASAWTERTSAAQQSTSYADNISGSGTTYYYKVTPENKLATNVTFYGADSGTSAALSVTQPAASIFPLVSANAKSILVLYGGSAGSGSIPNYAVYRGQNTNPQTNIKNAAGTQTSSESLLYEDIAATALSTTFYYKTTLTNNINTVSSSVASVTTPSGAAPSAPGTPSGTPDNVNNNILVSWSASNDAKGGGTVTYSVYRGQGAANANTFRQSTTGTQITDGFLATGTYYYRVTASTPWSGTATSQSGVSSGVSAIY